MEAPTLESTAGPYHALDSDLNEIRVATLLSGRFDDPVCCRLRHVSLSADAASSAYETVSYCWGDVTRKTSVQVDGYDVDVPLSAAEALRYFRQEDQERTVWIDSVCIQQNNIQERNQQVALMSRVYTYGTQNLVWLGPGEDEGAGSSEVLLHSLSVIQERITTIDAWMDYDLTFGERHEDPSGPLPSDILEPIARFILGNPFFRRMWVVQEVVLAKSNICQLGHSQLSLVDVMRASEYLYFNGNTLQSELWLQLFPSLKRITNMHYFLELRHGLFRPKNISGPLRLTLNILLIAARDFQVTEPKDIVYGILGLYESLCTASANPASLPSMLAPQYDSPLTTVFAKATRQAILDKSWLNVFRNVTHRAAEPNPPGWPSWVPRYDRSETIADPAQLVCFTYHRASADTPAQLLGAPTVLADTLALKGFPVASVQNDRVGSVSRSLESIDQCLDFFEDIRQILDPQASKNPMEIANDQVGRVLIAGVARTTRPATDRDVSDIRGFVACIREGVRPVPLYMESANPLGSEEVGSRRQALRYVGPFMKACRRRRFFKMTSGTIGIGPETMQVGDVLSILYGGETPFILRPRGAEYEFVGDCYVDELMNGEAVQKHKDSGAEDTIFVLK